MSSENRWAEYRDFIENYLRNFYAQFHSEPQAPLFEAMEYSLMAGGKRLRPCFVFEFCRLCGGEWKQAAPFAAAIEMIHTYSLIHDDLPCMDNDDFRRGKPTNHRIYGEAMAVLAGDALLTDAFAVAASMKLPDPTDFPTAIGILGQCAGSLGMVGGQVLDIMSEKRVCTEQEVLNIQSRKTGALINAACVLGVLAGGGDEEHVEAAASFAGLLGLAFQIRDDMLDVIGSAQVLGKAVGVDQGKNTFVRLYGLEKCEELVAKYTDSAIEKLHVFPDHEALAELARGMTGRMH